MPPRPKTVSLTEIADVFGVTTETIRLWRKAGMPSRKESGRPTFVIAECVQWRREQDREDVRVDDGLDKDAEMAAKLRVERELKELELAERRSRVVPIEVYQERLDSFLGGLMAVVDGRLQQFERDIVQADTPPDARRITDAIRAELRRGATEYADELERAAEEESDPPPGAPGEDAAA